MKGIIIALITICGLQIANAKEEVILTSKNHCELAGEVNGDSMQTLSLCLADKAIIRRKRDYPIYLVVNSGGGEIYAGLKFIEFAKTIKNIETVTMYAASMASAIVEALPGKRHGTAIAVTMFHRAKGSFQGQFEDGEVEGQLRLWKKIVRSMETTNSKRIGITLREYKSRVVNEWYIFGEANVTQNVLDVISVVKCSAKLLSKKTKYTVQDLFGSYEVTVSACPLVN